MSESEIDDNTKAILALRATLQVFLATLRQGKAVGPAEAAPAGVLDPYRWTIACVFEEIRHCLYLDTIAPLQAMSNIARILGDQGGMCRAILAATGHPIIEPYPARDDDITPAGTADPQMPQMPRP